jgi:hypothetical protein
MGRLGYLTGVRSIRSNGSVTSHGNTLGSWIAPLTIPQKAVFSKAETTSIVDFLAKASRNYV